ncbi:hypothetical protein BBP40_002380 [Aspergillus hancockii]|nr:hypothetical protein BBP40_002380 [Aspergillus hancockii]
MAESTGRAVAATSTWKLTASLTGLYASTLYEFFDSTTKDGVVSLLDEIEVKSLTVTYTYQSGMPSGFQIQGTLILGGLPLTLSFKNTNGKWEFLAKLALGHDNLPTTTIGQIVQHIFGPDVELPPFVADIAFTPPEDEQTVGLDIVATAGKDGEKKDMLFTAWVRVEGISFQAIQFQAAAPPSGTKPPAQRAFVIDIGVLPDVSIPLIGSLPQPFDEMRFMYVQKHAGNNAPLGLSYKEVTSINTALAGKGRLQLPYRATKKAGQYKPGDLVIPAGFHFMLLRTASPGTAATVVLDYVFGSKKNTAEKALQPFHSSRTLTDTEPADGGSQKAPYEKSIGPLTIRNLGLKFAGGDNPSLSLLLDASIVLGPIGVAILGFKLIIPLKGVTLSKLPTPGWDIAGLAVSFDRAPVILAGMFQRVGKAAYQGAATVSFQPYLFEAAGFYGQMEGDWVSAFVYFILNGPLATLEFAEIRGVTGGFGYHSSLKFPTVTKVMDFPLIKTPDATDPKKALDTLLTTEWFFAQRGSFWLAAGLTVLAFEMLDIKAVLVVEWDPQVKLGLFGLATADIPAGSPTKFARVQLGLVAVIDFNAGTFQVEGQLTPASFVLDPNCHLTGGFALYCWFIDHNDSTKRQNAVAGDFVFTIGGYHRSYQPPSQYPRPPRLGISWSYDASISIRGEAYFAITPKCCMAGGRLDASLTLGPLYAFFDAYADLLINYKPFHFTAEGGLSIGVRFTLDLWICTVHISIEISAMLYLQGPPIAGRVHVNFWVFGFDINFGQLEGPAKTKLDLEGFYSQVLQTDLPTAAMAMSSSFKSAAAATTLPPPHIFSCNQGLIPPNKNDASSRPNEATWKVRGAIFQFTVACKFAVNSATVVTGPVKDKIPPLPVPGNGQSIYARPMGLTKDSPLTSTLTVTITAISPKQPKLMATPLVPRWDTATLQIKSVPLALWGPYDPSADPLNPGNTNPNGNKDLLSGKQPSVPLPMAIQISSPKPVLSTDDTLPPFKYKTFFNENVSKEPFPFPDICLARVAWYPQAAGAPADMWKKVRDQWDGTPKMGIDAPDNAVKLWAGLSVTKWKLDTPGALSGKKPANLLKKGVFETLFLEAPRLGPEGFDYGTEC